MGITIRGHHGLQAGTTAITPSPPAGTTTDDVEVIWTSNKNPSSTPTSPPPANGVGTWVLAGQATVGTGADGAGIGQMLISVWKRILTGTGVGTTVSISGANCSMAGGVVATKGGGDPAWDITVSFGSDTSSGTGFSATVADNLNLAVGEVLVSVGFFTANTSLPGRGLGIPGVTSTLTGVDSGGTANGNDMFGWTDRRVSTAGTQSGASTTTGTAGVATTGGCVHIRIGLATSTNLVVDAGTQAQAADSPALTQDHSLTVDVAAQSQLADSPALTQVHALTVQDAIHTQTADSPGLQVVLAVQDAAQAQTADSPVLVQQHTLAVDASAQAQAADALMLTQVHLLAVSSPTQDQVSGAPALTQVHNLTVDAAAHTQAADSPAVNSSQNLVVDAATHGQAADSPTLIQAHTVTVDGAAQQQTSTVPTLTQLHILETDDVLQALTSDDPSLTQVHTLVVQDAAQDQAASVALLDLVDAITLRPFTGVISRPLTGVTTRPDSGITIRP